LFGDKQIHDLIFDEVPYKIYSAKVTGSATIKYLVFEEKNNKRVYKGEGSVQFTCYNPFARCAFPEGNYDELKLTYENIDEWWDASRIGDGNFGDIDTTCIIEIPSNVEGRVSIDGGKELSWSSMNEDVTLDTKLGVAIGDLSG
jgi:hypothetical protein